MATFSPAYQPAPIDLSVPPRIEEARERIANLLEAVPTLFGRLVLVAEMLDRTTGIYSSPELELCVAPRILHRELKTAHEQRVIVWLDSPLELRTRDLLVYFRRMRKEGVMAAGRMIRSQDYADLLPPGVPAVHKKHFAMEMNLVLSLVYPQL